MVYQVPKTIFDRLLQKKLDQHQIQIQIQEPARRMLHKNFESFLIHIIQLALQNAKDNRNTGNVTGKDIRASFAYFIRE